MAEEEILHEYPQVGKYRIRVVRKETTRSSVTALDVREYVQAEKFEGFTRRGIRLQTPADLLALADALRDAAGRALWFPANGKQHAAPEPTSSEPAASDPTPSLF